MKDKESYKCMKCGTDINEGEYETFGVCDSCYDKTHAAVIEPAVDVPHTVNGVLDSSTFGDTKIAVPIKKDNAEHSYSDKEREKRLEQFDKHHEKIAEVIVGCTGVISREVHWSEVAPMIAAYLQQQLKEERNKAINEALKHLYNHQGAFTQNKFYLSLKFELESLKNDLS